MPRVAVRNPNGSLQFDGASTVVSCGTGASLQTTSFTYSIDVKRIGTGTQDLFAWTGAGGPKLRLGSGTEDLTLVQSSVSVIGAAGNVIKYGVWTSVGVTYDSLGNWTLYVNGNVVASGLDLRTWTFATAFNIGFGANPLKGRLSRAKVFSTAFTSTQMKALHLSNVYSRASLVGEWALDEMTGTTANDTSGNGNNGTITAGTWSADRPFANRNAVVDYKASLQSDNSTTKTTIADTAIYRITNNLTISAWVNPLIGTNMSVVSKSPANIPAPYDFVIQSTGFLRLYMGNGSSVAWNDSTVLVKQGVWQHIACVFSSNNVTFYINGQIAGGGAISTTIADGGSAVIIGNRGDSGAIYKGKISQVKVFNTAFSSSDMLSLYNNKTTSISRVGDFAFTEGAGSIAYDSSSNANNGTITGATWSSDTPSKARKIVGGNMIPNGDFSYIPVVNVAQTTSGRFIDGTSTGSTTNNLFKWNVGFGGASSAMFDTSNLSPLGSPSLKISTLAVASYVEAFTPTPTGGTGGYYTKTNISVLPNTSYTYSFYMKTQVTSGTSLDGANVTFLTVTGDGATASLDIGSTKVVTTTPWTLYTGTFTTPATARYVQIDPRNYGHTGAGTLIMDAWFANISLVPTSQLTASAQSRLPSSRKVVSGNLVKNGDFSYVPTTSVPTNSGVVTVWLDGTATGSSTRKEFAWAVFNGSTGAAVSLDTDTTDTLYPKRLKAVIGSALLRTTNTPITSQPDIGQDAVPLLPNTSYTITYAMKVVWTSGSAGCSINLRQRNGTGTGGTLTSPGTVISSSTGWTNYSFTTVTDATTRYGSIELIADGASGLVGTVYVANIQVVPTSQLTASATSRLPSSRLVVDGNLVPNGDFSYYPSPNVATTASGVWVDGTAGGSATRNDLKWAMLKSGTVAVLFDTTTKYSDNASLKLSTTAVSSWIEMNQSIDETATNIKLYAPKALPSRSYNYSFRMKTNYISGDSSDGAFVAIREFDGTGTAVATTTSTKIKVTSDWTYYSGTFTTSSTTAFMYPRLSLYGHTGAGTLIMDAWIDDVSITLA